MLAGAKSRVHFTHLSKSSVDFLTRTCATSEDDNLAEAQCHSTPVLDLMKQLLGESALGKVCLLDPKAEKELSPEDGDGRFEWFLFGVSVRSVE